MAMAVFWVLWAIAAVGGLRWIVYLFFGGIAFGAMNTLPGSINLLPAAACGPLLTWRVLRALSPPGTMMDCLLNWRRLGLLTGYIAMSLVVTVSAPVLFPGVTIMGMNSLRPEGLHFTGSSIAQIAYLVAGYCVTVSVFTMIQSREGRRLLAEGLQVGAAMLILSGGIDFALGSAPLNMFKTAGYTMFIDAEIADLGMKRVVGLYSEASAYGAATLAFAACLIFMRPAREFGGMLAMMDVVAGLMLEGMTCLSTSTGALAGLGVLVALQGWVMLANAVAITDRDERARAHMELLLGLAVLSVVLACLIMAPGILTKIYQMIDRLILQKGSTDSFAERSTWTRTTFQAVLATYGYGIGAGASRSSNWAVAVLGTGGVVGAGLMGAFLVRCLFGSIPRGGSPVAFMGRGGRYAFLVALVPALGSATTADYGPVVGTIVAVMAGAVGWSASMRLMPDTMIELAVQERAWRGRPAPSPAIGR